MTQEILSDNEALVERILVFRYGTGATYSESRAEMMGEAREFAVRNGLVKLLPPSKPTSEGERIAEREIKLASNEGDCVSVMGWLARPNEDARISLEEYRDYLRRSFARLIDAVLAHRTEQAAKIVEHVQNGHDPVSNFIRGNIAAAIRKLNEAL